MYTLQTYVKKMIFFSTTKETIFNAQKDLLQAFAYI
jgi:hypothetical protein